MKKQKLPHFDSIDELAQFWDTHDLADFEDELEEVTEPLFIENGQQSVVKFYLQSQESAILDQLAQSRGIRQEILVREWVLEKLQAV